MCQNDPDKTADSPWEMGVWYFDCEVGRKLVHNSSQGHRKDVLCGTSSLEESPEKVWNARQ